MDRTSSGLAPNPVTLPTPADVRDAFHRIGDLVHRTPVMTSRTFNRLAGRDVFFKCENLQRTGAFKLRGAANFVLAHHEEDPRPLRGLVAGSSGNHGQAVAYMAQHVGVPATIVVPRSIRPSKRAALVEYGARVVEVDSTGNALAARAQDLARADGLLDVPPFDAPLVMAGQGTCVYETLTTQLDAVDAVVCPVGGGGLAAGTVLGVAAASSQARVYGVEPEAANDTQLSFRAGRRIHKDPEPTEADALLTPIPGELTFAVNREHLADVLTVSEAEIAFATRWMWERCKLVLEPSSCVPVASVLNGSVPGRGAVLVILSGGNAQFPTATVPNRVRGTEQAA
jgi:threonine dehydratase